MTAVRTRRRSVTGVAVLVLAPALAACGNATAQGAATAASYAQSGKASPGDDVDAAAGGATGEIVVSAAASLTDAFTEVGQAFETANPQAEVTFTFGPSSGLATQIVEGAPADVAAFANDSTMQTIVDAGAVTGEPTIFATNDLIIVTKPGNPQGITGLADLADTGVVALCGAEAPCGSLAQDVLANADVTIPETSVTRGEDVRATLTAVSQGDAVAAIVYETDAAAVGDAVAAVEIPAEVNVLATYPVAVLAGSGNPATATAFVQFVRSPDAQEILADHGFAPPTT